jgi:hypothetical protein
MFSWPASGSFHRCLYYLSHRLFCRDFMWLFEPLDLAFARLTFMNMLRDCGFTSRLLHVRHHELNLACVKIPTFYEEFVFILCPTTNFLLVISRKWLREIGALSWVWLVYVFVIFLICFCIYLTWRRTIGALLITAALNIKRHYFFLEASLLLRFCNSTFRSGFIDLTSKKVLWKCSMKHPDWVCHISDTELIFLKSPVRQFFSLLNEIRPDLFR